MRRLFRRLRRQRPKPSSQHYVEIVFVARDEFTPTLNALADRLREIEEQARRAADAARRVRHSASSARVEERGK